ncbi:hypothetical protein F2Q69_00028972 [Brassica cretica]|uniref:Uncharacterized protein n=1 Tax=Brassica cretica TaxID=69181 RepID=A0A8S9RZQ6_BRACR|nr:hypothetical protein F2Q69_00028972 [Brassica cretica]
MTVLSSGNILRLLISAVYDDYHKAKTQRSWSSTTLDEGRSSPVTRRDILIQKELAVRRTRTSGRLELMKEWLEKNVGHWNPEEEYHQFHLWWEETTSLEVSPRRCLRLPQMVLGHKVGDSLEDVQPFKPWGFLDVFCLPGDHIAPPLGAWLKPKVVVVNPEGVLDHSRFVDDYPFSEFRLEPEHFSECVYGHLVAYSANSLHNQLESSYELAESTGSMMDLRFHGPYFCCSFSYVIAKVANVRFFATRFPSLSAFVASDLGLWFSLDVCQRLLSYRWKHRWDPSLHARLHRPLCLLRGIEGFRVPFLSRGCYTGILTRRTFPRCSRPIDWGCEVEFSSADFCRSARKDCTENIFLNSSSVAALAVVLATETAASSVF